MAASSTPKMTLKELAEYASKQAHVMGFTIEETVDVKTSDTLQYVSWYEFHKEDDRWIRMVSPCWNVSPPFDRNECENDMVATVKPRIDEIALQSNSSL